MGKVKCRGNRLRGVSKYLEGMALILGQTCGEKDLGMKERSSKLELETFEPVSSVINVLKLSVLCR